MYLDEIFLHFVVVEMESRISMEETSEKGFNR